MNSIETYQKLMECDKDFLVKFIINLDEWLTKYGSALNKACKELEELEKKYYYESVTFKHCKSASEWREEMFK